MDNSSRFFANKDCEFYPCHDCEGDINCLFCYCPLYDMDCPGNFRIADKGDRQVKSCKDCVFPHLPENYDTVISLLKNRNIHR